MKVQREQDDWMRREERRNKGTGGKGGNRGVAETSQEWVSGRCGVIPVHAHTTVNVYKHIFILEKALWLRWTSEQAAVKSTGMPSAASPLLHRGRRLTFCEVAVIHEQSLYLGRRLQWNDLACQQATGQALCVMLHREGAWKEFY